MFDPSQVTGPIAKSGGRGGDDERERNSYWLRRSKMQIKCHVCLSHVIPSDCYAEVKEELDPLATGLRILPNYAPPRNTYSYSFRGCWAQGYLCSTPPTRPPLSFFFFLMSTFSQCQPVTDDGLATGVLDIPASLFYLISFIYHI